MAHLVAEQPSDPVAYLFDLLDKCLLFRDGLVEPPLLFAPRYVRARGCNGSSAGGKKGVNEGYKDILLMRRDFFFLSFLHLHEREKVRTVILACICRLIARRSVCFGENVVIRRGIVGLLYVSLLLNTT